jgi:hypothetical protein
MINLSPAVLLPFEVALILAMTALFAAVALGLNGSRVRARSVSLQQRLYLAQRKTARSLGYPTRLWIVFRVVFVLAATGIGWYTQIPVLVWTSPLIGLFAVPWFFKSAAYSRQVKTDAALASFVRELVQTMKQSKIDVERSLKEIARTPNSLLSDILQPLRTEARVPEALIEVADRAQSPMAQRIAICLIASRTSTPKAFVEAAEAILIPFMEKDVELSRENNGLRAQQKQTSIMLVLIMSAMFLVLTRVDIFNFFYAHTLAGQITVAGIGGMVAGLVWLIGQLIRIPKWTEWDVRQFQKELEAAARG